MCKLHVVELTCDWSRAVGWVVATLELWVNGMTCAHCERAVTAELSSLASVESVRVDAASGRIELTHSAALSRITVRQAIEDAGYKLKAWSVDHNG